MNDKQSCPICQVTLESFSPPTSRTFQLRCPNCGRYKITLTALAVLQNLLQNARDEDASRRYLLAHVVRQRQRQNQFAMVDADLVEKTFGDQAVFPTAIEQVENLVIWLAEHLPHPGAQVDIVFEMFQAVIGAASRDAFGWVVQSARDRNLIQGTQFDATKGVRGGLVNASLTLKGWEWYNEISRVKHSRLAFMAMKYGDEQLDEIVEKYFKPAVKLTGFDLRRLDDEPEAGVIDDRLRVEIRRSRLLVCDLSHGNLGAYWEAGFAEGIGIPVIYTCEETRLEKGVHFDTRNSLIIPWSATNLPAAVDMLKATIRNTLPEDAILEDL